MAGYQSMYHNISIWAGDDECHGRKPRLEASSVSYPDGYYLSPLTLMHAPNKVELRRRIWAVQITCRLRYYYDPPSLMICLFSWGPSMHCKRLPIHDKKSRCCGIRRYCEVTEKEGP